MLSRADYDEGSLSRRGDEVCYCRHFGELFGAHVFSSRACPEESEADASVNRGGKREEEQREKEEGRGNKKEDGRVRGVGQE